METAQIILQQLGGNKFIVMTGSKNFAAGDKFLHMRLTRNKLGAQYLKISLNSLDLYDMTFSKMDKNFDIVVLAEHNGVYSDMLQPIFTQVTGLNTHL